MPKDTAIISIIKPDIIIDKLLPCVAPSARERVTISCEVRATLVKGLVANSILTTHTATSQFSSLISFLSPHKVKLMPMHDALLHYELKQMLPILEQLSPEEISRLEMLLWQDAGAVQYFIDWAVADYHKEYDKKSIKKNEAISKLIQSQWYKAHVAAALESRQLQLISELLPGLSITSLDNQVHLKAILENKLAVVSNRICASLIPAGNERIKAQIAAQVQELNKNASDRLVLAILEGASDVLHGKKNRSDLQQVINKQLDEYKQELEQKYINLISRKNLSYHHLITRYRASAKNTTENVQSFMDSLISPAMRTEIHKQIRSYIDMAMMVMPFVNDPLSGTVGMLAVKARIGMALTTILDLFVVLYGPLVRWLRDTFDGIQTGINEKKLSKIVLNSLKFLVLMVLLFYGFHLFEPVVNDFILVWAVLAAASWGTLFLSLAVKAVEYSITSVLDIFFKYRPNRRMEVIFVHKQLAQIVADFYKNEITNCEYRLQIINALEAQNRVLTDKQEKHKHKYQAKLEKLILEWQQIHNGTGNLTVEQTRELVSNRLISTAKRKVDHQRYKQYFTNITSDATTSLRTEFDAWRQQFIVALEEPSATPTDMVTDIADEPSVPVNQSVRELFAKTVVTPVAQLYMTKKHLAEQIARDPKDDEHLKLKQESKVNKAQTFIAVAEKIASCRA